MANIEFSDDRSQEGLQHQAEQIGALAEQLLETPDWEKIELKYEAPLAGGFNIELQTRRESGILQGEQLFVNWRQLTVHRGRRGGFPPMHVYVDQASRQELDVIDRGWCPKEPARLLEAIEDADPVAVRLVKDAMQLYVGGHDPKVLGSVTEAYSTLMEQGRFSQAFGLKQHNDSGTRASIFSANPESDKLWFAGETNVTLGIKVFSHNRQIGFSRYRSGNYETYEEALDKWEVLKATIGKKTMNPFASVSISAEKLAEIESTERAVGLRELRADYLGIIRSVLEDAAESRGLSR